MTMKKQLMTLALLFNLAGINGALADTGYNNPIIKGFYPDPSVCRVGDDYYLVNSTFEFFPGVPIHHSKDLVNWELIGYCLDRDSQLPLQNIPPSGGIYAPTIRYNNGIFYMITTNTTGGGNFFVYTDNPRGKWSEPIYLKQGGIDPSLYFEGDKCYMVSNPDGIHLCEIDIKTGKQLTKSKMIWRGTGGRYPEGPHVYKKDGWYYLLISEGGTEYGHKVTIARSKSIYGPYESNPKNPILTHINENAQSNPIQGTGHADLIQAHDGSWWMVFLGFRPFVDFHHMLGRETFLAPVEWGKDGWPVVNGGNPVNISMNVKTLPQVDKISLPEKDEFDADKLALEWNYLRNPDRDCYSLDKKKGFLTLKGSVNSLDDVKSTTFLCRRQQDFAFSSETLMKFRPQNNGDKSGISVFMRKRYHYDLYMQRENGENYLVLAYTLGEINHVEKKVRVDTDNIFLKVSSKKGDMYEFEYSLDGKTYKYLGKVDARFISTETAGGFTGVMIGLFAQSKSETSPLYADFDWFTYKPL